MYLDTVCCSPPPGESWKFKIFQAHKSTVENYFYEEANLFWKKQIFHFLMAKLEQIQKEKNRSKSKNSNFGSEGSKKCKNKDQMSEFFWDNGLI